MFCALNPVCGEPSGKSVPQGSWAFFGHLRGHLLKEDAPKKKHGAARTTSRQFLIADPPMSAFSKIIENPTRESRNSKLFAKRLVGGEYACMCMDQIYVCMYVCVEGPVPQLAQLGRAMRVCGGVRCEVGRATIVSSSSPRAAARNPSWRGTRRLSVDRTG